MGLGVGFLVGQTMANNRDQVQSHDDELAAMRRELQHKLTDVVYQEAFKVAAAEVHEEIISELALEANGKLPQRRLSDPANVQARNDEFADRAIRHVSRLSHGRTELSEERIKDIRKNRPIK